MGSQFQEEGRSASTSNGFLHVVAPTRPGFTRPSSKSPSWRPHSGAFSHVAREPTCSGSIPPDDRASRRFDISDDLREGTERPVGDPCADSGKGRPVYWATALGPLNQTHERLLIRVRCLPEELTRTCSETRAAPRSIRRNGTGFRSQEMARLLGSEEGDERGPSAGPQPSQSLGF